MTSRIILSTLVLALTAALPAGVLACSGTPGKPFLELLKEARSVVIVRVEGEQLATPKELLFNQAVAQVRVVETISGRPSKLKAIEFTPSWCGGHRLDVGAYYVALLSSNSEKLTLRYEDESILGLGNEYDEQDRLARSSSRLLLHFRNFARLGGFPEAFSVRPYLDLARMPVQLPSAASSR